MKLRPTQFHRMIVLLLPPTPGKSKQRRYTKEFECLVGSSIELAKCMNARLSVCCPDENIQLLEGLLLQFSNRIKDLPVIQIQGVELGDRPEAGGVLRFFRRWFSTRNIPSSSRKLSQMFFKQALAFVQAHPFDLVLVPIFRKNGRVIHSLDLTEFSDLQSTRPAQVTQGEKDASVA